jgi:hypothetical protein
MAGGIDASTAATSNARRSAVGNGHGVIRATVAGGFEAAAFATGVTLVPLNPVAHATAATATTASRARRRLVSLTIGAGV